MIIQALVLGIVQGITEFLPISSSAHLLIIPALFGWQEGPLVFDLVLHLGTSLALVIFFWRDLFEMYWSLMRDIFTKKFVFSSYSRKSYLAVILIVANLPADIVGLLFNDLIENTFREIQYSILFLAAGTILMFVAEKFFSGKKGADLLAKINLRNSVCIGFFQCLAFLPGVSRSGSTISSGMIFGLSREEATRFSFLLSAPIILQAAFFEIVKSGDVLFAIPIFVTIAGFLSSFIAGILAIKFLLEFLKSKSLYIFIWYRIILILFLTFFS